MCFNLCKLHGVARLKVQKFVDGMEVLIQGILCGRASERRI